MPVNPVLALRKSGLPQPPGGGVAGALPEVTRYGALKTEPRVPRTAFGALRSESDTPQLQVTFGTHLSPIEWDITTQGDVAAAQGLTQVIRNEVSLSTEGNAGGGAQIESREHAFYQAGQGLRIQWSARFTTGAIGTTQLAGYGDALNGLFIGWDDDQFGCLLRSNASGTVVDTWFYQEDWDNEFEDRYDGTGPSRITLDSTTSNVYFVQAKLHYYADIVWMMAIPGIPDPVELHRYKHNDQTRTGKTLRTGSLPLHYSVQNDAGVTNAVTVNGASMAVFTEGRVRTGKFPFSATFERSSVTSEQHMMSLRMRSSVMGQPSHGHAFIHLTGTATSGNQPGYLRIYRDPVLFNTVTDPDTDKTLVWTQPHQCSIVETSATQCERLNIAAAANTTTSQMSVYVCTSSNATGSPVHQVTLTVTDSPHTPDAINGASNRLAGCIMYINNCARRILTSTQDGATAIVTVAAMPGVTADYNAQTVTIYNGEHVLTQSLGKDSSTSSSFVGDKMIHMSPGDMITLTADCATSSNIRASVNWFEEWC